jgi:hypothetical protein
MKTTKKPSRASRRAAPLCSAVECAAGDIARLEQALAPTVELMRLAHNSTTRASHELGESAGTGAAHACLGLMEVAMRSLHAANDAARYARHSLRYPSNNAAQARKPPEAAGSEG